MKDALDAMERGEPLFPKLAKRRTWLIVKMGLERAGIPDETKVGTASRLCRLPPPELVDRPKTRLHRGF